MKPDLLQRVVLIGPRSRQKTVLAAMHALRVVHIIPFDATAHPDLEGFEADGSLPGASDRAERLTRVRALLSRLGLRDRAPRQPMRLEEVREGLATRFDAIEREAMDAHAKLEALAHEWQEDDERERALTPLATLPLELEDYTGYESLSVLVGRAPRRFEDDVLEAAPESMLLVGDAVFALFVSRAAEAAAITALERHGWERIEPPEGTGHPRAHLAAIRARRDARDGARQELTSTLERLADAHGDLLLAAEEMLAFESDQDDAPLLGARTEHAFLLDAWVPASDLEHVETTLKAAVDDQLEVLRVRTATEEERRRAARMPWQWMYDHDGGRDPERTDLKTISAALGGGAKVTPPKLQVPQRFAWVTKLKDVLKKIFAKRRARQDALALPYDPLLRHAPPPTKYDNWFGVRRFQYFVNLFSTPRHDEVDPTILVALFFPLLCGFMVGDVGFGVLMLLLGIVTMVKLKEVPAMKQVGAALAAAGIVAALFGAFVFHDAMGIAFTHHDSTVRELALAGVAEATCQHLYDLAGTVTWTCLAAGGNAALATLPHMEPPIHKVDDVDTMLLLSLAAGAVHLLIGLALGVRNALGPAGRAVTAKASVILLLVALVPALMVISGRPLGPIGDRQALVICAIAFVIAGGLVLASTARDTPQRRHMVMAKLAFLVLLGGFLAAASAMLGGPLGPLSVEQAYIVAGVCTLIGASMLAWAEGFAGVLEVPSMLTAIFSYLRLGAVAIAKGAVAIAFTSVTLVTLTMQSDAGIISGAIGIVLFALAQVLLFALGVLSAGIQALRLNLVEFFTKFFVGGGEAYKPFGRLRRATYPPEGPEVAPARAPTPEAPLLAPLA